MVTGWRRAFCTSIPKDQQPKTATPNNNHPTTPTTRSPKLGFSKFTFFSSSSSSPSTPKTPTLRCKTAIDEPPTTPKLNCKTPPPSSPQSPSSFSLLLKNSLRFNKHSSSRSCCGVCLHNVKTGQGTAIFTAECSHTFHFPCITSLAVKTNNGLLLSCPLCGSHWTEPPFLAVVPQNKLRLYDDDEPLVTHPNSIQFNPIPESEEEIDDNEFPGFFSDPSTPRPQIITETKGIKLTISPESAVIAVGRNYETYAVLLTVKAPPFPVRSRRPSVDVVVVLDIGSEMNGCKLNSIKRAIRGMISSLSSQDRISMVAFSSTSKRLLPLRRMTPSGKRSARRIIDAINLVAHVNNNTNCLNDALRKAAKVIQDRKEKNQFASIILVDGHDDERENHMNRCLVSSTRFSDIPVHTFRVGEDIVEEQFVRTVNDLLSVVVMDVRVLFGLAASSAAAEIAAVYSCTGRPVLLSSGSAKLGDLYSSEEREILIELKVPASSIGSNHMLSIRTYHKDPSFCKQVIYGGDQSMIVPRPHTIRSSDPKIQRLRSLFVMTRAVAVSRRLAERSDFVGAERLLTSARAVLGQSSLRVAAVEEYKRRVEAELAEVKWRRQAQQPEEKQRKEKVGGCCVDDKGEPLTPTSAWKAAERLAKVAMMRKNLNRVSDLHGFEDARF